MKVHIIGPNLLDQSKGSFHVHAEGCADVKRNREYQLPDFAHDRTHTWEVSSRLDAAAQTYADQIGEGSMDATDGVNDMWFAPCCDDLPHDAPTRSYQATVTIVVDATDEQDALRQAQQYPSESRLNWEITPIDGAEQDSQNPPEGALPIGTYVQTKTWGYRGRIYKVHDRCPEGAAWRMGQSVPLTGVYADGGGTWYSILVHPSGSACVTADDVEVVEPFEFQNPYADTTFTD